MGRLCNKQLLQKTSAQAPPAKGGRSHHNQPKQRNAPHIQRYGPVALTSWRLPPDRPPKSGRTGDVCAVRTYASKRHEAESKPSRPQGAGDTATHHAPLQSTCRAGQGAPDKHVAQPYKLALRGSEATTHRLWGHGCFAHRRRPPSRRPTERRGHLGQASDPAPPPRSDARFVGAQRCRMNASWTDTRHRRQALRRAVCTLCWATDRCRPLGVGATHTHGPQRTTRDDGKSASRYPRTPLTTRRSHKRRRSPIAVQTA